MSLAQVANATISASLRSEVIQALLKVLKENTPSPAQRFLGCASGVSCFSMCFGHAASVPYAVASGTRVRGLVNPVVENCSAVRHAVVTALTEIAEHGAPGEIAPILVEPLVDRLNNDEDPRVRKAVVSALGKVADQNFFVATLQSRLSRETDPGVLRALQAQVATDP